jgi:hypothetical protein
MRIGATDARLRRVCSVQDPLEAPAHVYWRRERAVRQDGNDHLAPDDGALPSRQGVVFRHRMVIPILANCLLSSPADVRRLSERKAEGLFRTAARSLVTTSA